MFYVKSRICTIADGIIFSDLFTGRKLGTIQGQLACLMIKLLTFDVLRNNLARAQKASKIKRNLTLN